MRLRLFVDLDDQVFQNSIVDLDDTVDFFDDFRFAFKVNQNVVAISLFLNRVCQMAFPPTIYLFDTAAVLGKKEIMDAAQGSWISSTFWTDRIGPTAALAALDEMERVKSWEVITEKGKQNKVRWQALADKYGLKINQWGIPALAGYTFDSPNALAYKTYVTQEMLKKGFLASNNLYTCIAHTPEILDAYFDALDPIFAEIRDFEDGKDVMKALEGPVCQTGFKRLN